MTPDLNTDLHDTMSTKEIMVRSSARNDCVEIIRLIKELAEFEKLSDQMRLSPEELEKDGFGQDKSFFECLVGDIGGGQLVAYCLYYFTYSTFQGKSLYLEDLYVSPEYRGKGIGTRILKALSKVAIDNSCARLDFIVLNWNEKALAYYRKLGGEDLTQTEKWHLFRLDKPQLNAICEG